MSKSKWLWPLIGVIIVTTCLFPVLRSGLYSDDLESFHKKKVNREWQAQSVFSITVNDVKHWSAMGRINPVGLFWYESAFKYSSSIARYKAFIFVMNLVAIAAFLFYVAQLNIRYNTAMLLACLACTFQFRVLYHDAYTSLHALFQLLAVCIFMSLAFYCKFIKSKRRIFLGISCVIFLLGQLVYEIALLTVLLLPVTALVLRLPVKTFIKTSWPYFLLATVYVACILYIRVNAVINSSFYSGLTSNTEPFAMINVLLIQLFSALPLSALYNQAAIPLILAHQLGYLANLISVGIIITGGTLIYYRHKKRTADHDLPLSSMLVLAFSLMVLPVFFIMPSVKYQEELKWGIGYLPVYLQSFGTGLLLYSLLNTAVNARGFLLGVIGACIMIFIVVATAVSFLFNSALINVRSYQLSLPAEALYQSVKHGVLGGCADNSVLVLANDFYCYQPNVYEQIIFDITGKKLNVYDIGQTPALKDTCGNVNCYILECPPGNPIVTTLYQGNCGSDYRGNVLARTITACDIQVTDEEMNIHY